MMVDIMEINSYILEQCKKEYPKVDIVLDQIQYTIEHYNGIEKIKFTFDNGCCPIYCLCDDRYMMWYGDHGSFTFDCTWKTSLMKIPFNSPHYLFEKLDKSGAKGTGLVWNSAKAKKAVLETIYESSWWEEEIESDIVRDEIKQLFEGPAWKDSFYYHTGQQDDEMLDALKRLLNETENEWRFATCLNDLPESYPINSEDYELYECGNEITPHFWFILLGLNYIYCKELEKQDDNEKKLKEIDAAIGGIFDACM